MLTVKYCFVGFGFLKKSPYLCSLTLFIGPGGLRNLLPGLNLLKINVMVKEKIQFNPNPADGLWFGPHIENKDLNPSAKKQLPLSELKEGNIYVCALSGRNVLIASAYTEQLLGKEIFKARGVVYVNNEYEQILIRDYQLVEQNTYYREEPE